MALDCDTTKNSTARNDEEESLTAAFTFETATNVASPVITHIGTPTSTITGNSTMNTSKPGEADHFPTVLVPVTMSFKTYHPMTLPPTRRDDRKLFVGGLPPDVTEDEFRSYFEQFGPVFEAVVMFDRITGRSRGFGFVTFHDKADRTKLIGDIGDEEEGEEATSDHQPPKQPLRLIMRGKTIEVKAAQPKVAAPANLDYNSSYDYNNIYDYNNNNYAAAAATPGIMNYSDYSNLAPPHSPLQQQPPFYYFPTLTTTAPQSPTYYPPPPEQPVMTSTYPIALPPAMFYPLSQ